MEMGQALELVGEYTADQWGMVTARQAKTSGVDAVTLYRLKEAGFLDIVRRGVYAATSAPASPAREEQAVWLALRPDVPGWERPKLDPDGGVLSHQSAARLHGLGDLVNDRIEVTVPRRRRSTDPAVRFHTTHLDETDIALIDGLPLTTALRTICDLLDQHIDASHIATIIRQAVEAGLVQLDELAERLGPYARRYGVRPLNGAALLEHLLQQIGLSITKLATRPTPITQGHLASSRAPWNELTSLPNLAAALTQLQVPIPNIADATRDIALSPAARESLATLVVPPQLRQYLAALGMSPQLQEVLAHLTTPSAITRSSTTDSPADVEPDSTQDDKA